jgi:hypothetical protein
VTINEETGDQLFSKFTSGTLCLNFSTFPTLPFPFTVSGQFEFTGGTGEYAGASGTGNVHFTGGYLQFGFKGGVFGGFGQFTFTSGGTLILPKHNED